VTRPFEGVKILDFTQVLAGPYASYQLALLGADVIKVERREGEDMRRTPLSREWADRGLAPGWQAINGNKRSLTLDLQKPEAITIVTQLAASADVVMENFRPGVMDKLGIGYAALSAVNPRLIYCAISGFGQTGPERSGAGYDGKIQAMSGIMAITGHAETGPTRAGFAVCDVLSGATAAFGVSSALFQRTHTGKGQMVDVSMLEATLAFLSGQVADYAVAGHRQQLSGNQAVSRRLAGRFDVAEFRREFDRRDGKVTGRYDASVLGFDPNPDSSFYRFDDPSGDPLIAPLTSAAVEFTTRKLNWRPDGSYQLLNGAVEKAWDFGRGRAPAESISQLRQILALDPKLKLLVGHGLFDLATPYFGSKILLDQLPAYASPERVKLVVYPGGHMFYSRDASRQAFRAEAEALMK